MFLTAFPSAVRAKSNQVINICTINRLYFFNCVASVQVRECLFFFFGEGGVFFSPGQTGLVAGWSVEPHELSVQALAGS